MILGSLFALCFRLDLFDEFLGHFAESVFNNAKAMLQAVILLVPNLIGEAIGLDFIRSAE
ncbi:hypothetical protein [Rhizobium sp. NXC14]|uniref:hypothetical protein n=1 Tax=Rhizobium sp. NXC14 TaxID=1981173 RepID=UPI0018DB5212|nr:hypothetical protein [Rhizobium sp. NXC14]